MIFIFQYIWRQRLRVLLGLSALLIVDALQLVIPLVVRSAIDQIGKQPQANFLKYGVQIFALGLGIFLFRFIWRYLLLGAARKIRRDVRDNLFAHLVKLPAEFFQRKSTGDIMALATNDVEAISLVCGFGLMASADALFLSVMSIAAMLSIDPTLTLYSFLPLPILTVFVILAGRSVHRRFEVVQGDFGRLTEQVRETISGIRVVKSFAQERGFLNDFAATNQQFLRRNMELVRISGLFDPFVALLASCSATIALLVGGEKVVGGEISIGSFVAFNSYLLVITWPMMALGLVINMLNRASASAKRIQEVLREKPEDLKDPGQFLDIGPPRLPSIEVRALTFSYPKYYGERAPALIDLSLKIAPGETVAVIGLTGSGKSTFINLLTRIFDPKPGTLFINGRDILEMSVVELRDLMAVSLQDPFLFSASVKRNIAFGNSAATDDEVIRAAKLAGIHNEIVAMPEGYETVIGERGVSLSGGQRSRVALARALLIDASLLVLDDPFASVDAAKEEELIKNLLPAIRIKSCILVTHRVSAARHADQIIVMEQGRIVQSGKHEGLLNVTGLYRQLFELQSAERELSGR